MHEDSEIHIFECYKVSKIELERLIKDYRIVSSRVYKKLSNKTSAFDVMQVFHAALTPVLELSSTWSLFTCHHSCNDADKNDFSFLYIHSNAVKTQSPFRDLPVFGA